MSHELKKVPQSIKPIAAYCAYKGEEKRIANMISSLCISNPITGNQNPNILS